MFNGRAFLCGGRATSCYTRPMNDDLNDQNVAQVASRLRAAAGRGLQPQKLNAVADEVEEIWAAIKSGDQKAVNALGPALMQNRAQLPVSESPDISSAVPVIDMLLSHVQLQSRGVQ